MPIGWGNIRLSVDGTRFEIPSRYRTLLRPTVRYARWDLRRVDLVDAHTGAALCPLYPLDKTANADGQRRRLAVPDASPMPSATGMAPLLRQLIDAQEATGLPPAYLPKEQS